MAERRSILHVLPSPYYGAASNSCFTVRDDLGALFTTDIVLVSDFEGYDADWKQGFEYLSMRCSSIRTYASADDIPEDLAEMAGAAYCIEYDPDRTKRSDGSPAVPGAGRSVLWEMNGPSERRPGDGEALVSSLYAKPGRGVYPMIISGKLKSIAGSMSRPTVGVLFSPFEDVWFRDRADVLACAAIRASREGGRVIVSDTVAHFPLPSAEALAEERKVQLTRLKWCVGHEWKVGAICDVAVCPLPSNGGFPFVMATCMSEGRACVGVYDGEAPDCFVKDSVNAFTCHSNDLDGLASRIWWLLGNRRQLETMATNAQLSSYFYDKDSCLPPFRGALFG